MPCICVNSTSESVLTKGHSVLLLGIVNGPAITASHVIVQTGDKGGSATSSAAGLVPFQRCAPSAEKQIGQIPANAVKGGTIVSGTEANKAIEAALDNYPGGIVSRVVSLLSFNGTIAARCNIAISSSRERDLL